MPTGNDDPSISLEDHLVDVLRLLRDVLPSELAQSLDQFLSQPRPGTIPYSVLQSISKWSRSDAGHQALHSRIPPLNPMDYSMVSLLAGTATWPERNFGPYAPPMSPEEIGAIKARERKAITALLNGLLSTIACGFAAWWAAGTTGWKNEWRVLFALSVAFVVAASESILFLIWQARSTRSRTRQPGTQRIKRDEDKVLGNEGSNVAEFVSSSAVQLADVELRRRQ